MGHVLMKTEKNRLYFWFVVNGVNGREKKVASFH